MSFIVFIFRYSRETTIHPSEKGYRCEWDIPLYKQRVNWNYVYNKRKERNKCNLFPLLVICFIFMIFSFPFQGHTSLSFPFQGHTHLYLFLSRDTHLYHFHSRDSHLYLFLSRNSHLYLFLSRNSHLYLFLELKSNLSIWIIILCIQNKTYYWPSYIFTRNRHILCVKSVYCSGRRSKQRTQSPSFLRKKGPRGGIRNLLLLYFPYWPESQKIISIPFNLRY